MARAWDSMDRRSFLGASAAVASFTLAACGGTQNNAATTDAATDDAATDASEITGTYTRFVQGDDWGCGVSHVTLTLSAPVDAVTADTFTVSETKDATDWTDPEFAVKSQTNALTVTDAYLVDANGAKTTDASANVCIELFNDPNTASPFNYSLVTGRNTWTPYTMEIALAEGAALTSGGTAVTSLTVDPAFTATETSADEFTTDSFTASDGTTYKYAHYEPEGGSKTLVVWLHGGGEGGAEGIETDPSIVLLANEAANLVKEDFQKAVGGANVLVPQCPTFWMDNGKLSGSADDIVANADDKSLFTASLKELIADFKQKTSSEKVVLVGCSNGGYMTLVLGKTDPDLYDVYVPICGPLRSEYITDEEFAGLKDKPLFFIWAKADTTVDPATFEEPLVKRLQDANAADLHVYNPDAVVDNSGRFTDAEGKAYEYAGHWSWIYFFNDEAVDEAGLSAWDFIAERVK